MYNSIFPNLRIHLFVFVLSLHLNFKLFYMSLSKRQYLLREQDDNATYISTAATNDQFRRYFIWSANTKTHFKFQNPKL